MKTINFLAPFSFIIIISLIITTPFQSCKPDDEDCDSCSIAYKPNIYIYPSKQIKLSVKLNFPKGGKIITSIPNYKNGWNVLVDTSGLINSKYSYLFYESKQPDVWQKNNGWIIQTNELELFFRKNMTNYGFNNNEINDFIDYWIPKLNNYTYYSIYPQTQNIINDVIQLDFSKKPDNLLRLFYFIKGNNKAQDKLQEPTINHFKRDGYFVTEWGVILE